ncbi:MAG: CDP-alcohol phosphatidyltransferase family protein [Nitrososphaerota archaeon]
MRNLIFFLLYILFVIKVDEKMITRIRFLFEKIFNKIIKEISSRNISPMFFSFLGLFFSFFSAFFYIIALNGIFYLFLATFFLLLSGFFDAIDGAVARTSGKVTLFGAYIDSVLDRYVDIIIGISFIIGKLCSFFWGFLYIIGALMVSYTRARAESIGINLSGIGFAERGERIIFLILLSLITAIDYGLFEYGIILLSFLCHFTAIQRTIHVFLKTK